MSQSRVRVAIVGGSGYTGGELIRLLLFHPMVDIAQVASESQAGRFVHSAHPNLRKITALRFCHPDDLTSCDVLFLCLPHGVSQNAIERYRSLASHIIDLSGDFRLRSPENLSSVVWPRAPDTGTPTTGRLRSARTTPRRTTRGQSGQWDRLYGDRIHSGTCSAVPRRGCGL